MKDQFFWGAIISLWKNRSCCKVIIKISFLCQGPSLDCTNRSQKQKKTNLLSNASISQLLQREHQMSLLHQVFFAQLYNQERPIFCGMHFYLCKRWAVARWSSNSCFFHQVSMLDCTNNALDAKAPSFLVCIWISADEDLLQGPHQIWFLRQVFLAWLYNQWKTKFLVGCMCVPKKRTCCKVIINLFW